MNDDDRIHHYLAERAATITLPPSEPTAIIERATRRRHRRRTMSASVATLAALAATIGYVSLGGKADEKVETALEPGAAIVDSPLHWTAVERTDGLAWSASSALLDNGALYSLSTAPGPMPTNGEYNQRQSLYRSDDGLDWTEVALPSDVYASNLAANGGRLYAVGTSPTAGGRDVVLTATDDGGDNWSDAVLDVGLRDLDAAFPRQIAIDPPTVAANSHGVLVGVIVRSRPDVQALLGDRAPENAGWGYNGDGVDVYAPPECVETAKGADGVSSMECQGEAIGPNGRHEPEVVGHYSWDELGLDPTLRDLINGQLHVFQSIDGSSFTEVPLPAGLATLSSNGGPAQVLAANDGYRLFVGSLDADGNSTVRVLHSPDGAEWGFDSLDGADGWLMNAGVLDGKPAAAISTPDGGAILRIADGGGGWSTVDLGAALGIAPSAGRGTSLNAIAFGPMGVAAVIGTYDKETGEQPDNFVLHSTDGATFGLFDIDESVLHDNAWPTGVSVTADAITVRFTTASDGNPRTIEPQRLLVGTPED